MKILVLADQKSKYLYDFYDRDKIKDEIGRAHV